MCFAKPVYSLIFLLFLFSCRENIDTFQVEKHEICNYFILKHDTTSIDGKIQNSYSPEINDKAKKEGLYFFKKFSLRFDYLLLKEMKAMFASETLRKKNFSDIFCKRLQSDSLYNNFQLLLPATSTSAIFTKDEMMLVASRFFYCDTILKRDTSVEYHICGAINGLSEIKYNKNISALEAFIFEALFASMKNKNPRFLDNFSKHLQTINAQEKSLFIDFDNHLKKVKQRSYDVMQRDEALQKSLLAYYAKRKNTIGFSIQ